MTVSPNLVEALTEMGLAFIASSVVAPLAAWLKSAIGRRETKVFVKLSSGRQVRLDLDDHLSAEAVSALVTAAVKSAQSGDERGMKNAADASHSASQKARALSAD